MFPLALALALCCVAAAAPQAGSCLFQKKSDVATRVQLSSGVAEEAVAALRAVVESAALEGSDCKKLCFYVDSSKVSIEHGECQERRPRFPQPRRGDYEAKKFGDSCLPDFQITTKDECRVAALALGESSDAGFQEPSGWSATRFQKGCVVGANMKTRLHSPDVSIYVKTIYWNPHGSGPALDYSMPICKVNPSHGQIEEPLPLAPGQGSHKLVAACKGQAVAEHYGEPRFERDTSRAGGVVCCATSAHHRVRTRKYWGSCAARLGDDGDGLVTYSEALLLCQHGGLTLCPSEPYAQAACGGGCNSDNALVWTSMEQ